MNHVGSLLVRFLLLPGVLVAFQATDAVGSAHVTVSTTDGIVTGVRRTVGSTGAAVWQFLGIPFAEPPVGRRRFARPVRLRSRHPPLKATVQPPACPQPPDPRWAARTSEDCLYLNVWAPTTKSKRRRPVIVWIHGGGFINGSASQVDGAALAALGGTVVVGIQYRLGLFGFLRLDQSLVTGNWGLFDQRLALQWVRSNAKAFGGDPDAITIFGSSAGSVSVALHLFSEESVPLFRQGMLDSGTLFIQWAFNPNAQAITTIHREMVHDDLRCYKASAEDLLDCLRRRSTEQLLAAQTSFLERTTPNILFYPVMDGVFFRKDPERLLEGGWTPNKTLMVGVAADEMPGLLLMMLTDWAKARGISNPLSVLKGRFLSQVVKVFRRYQPRFPTPTPSSVMRLFQLVVPSRRDPNNTIFNFRRLADLMADDFMYCGTNRFVDHYQRASNGSSVFLYEFAHRSSNWKLPPWMGAAHGSSILYVFGFPLLFPTKFTVAEANLSRAMIEDWATFAATGRPRSAHWSPAGPRNEYLRLTAPNSTAERYWLRRDECIFMDSVVPFVARGGRRASDEL